MKILCICEGGNVRSVGLARLLKTGLKSHNAIAIGAAYALASYNDRQPGTYLCQWADLIVIMSEHFRASVPIPPGCEGKVKICEVGPDRYGNPSHPDLIKQCEEWIAKEGL